MSDGPYIDKFALQAALQIRQKFGVIYVVH